MTERRPIVAANWKMHKTHLEAIQAVQKLSYLLDRDDAERVEVVVAPPFTALRSIETLLRSARRTCITRKRARSRARCRLGCWRRSTSPT